MLWTRLLPPDTQRGRSRAERPSDDSSTQRQNSACSVDEVDTVVEPGPVPRGPRLSHQLRKKVLAYAVVCLCLSGGGGDRKAQNTLRKNCSRRARKKARGITNLRVWEVFSGGRGEGAVLRPQGGCRFLHDLARRTSTMSGAVVRIPRQYHPTPQQYRLVRQDLIFKNVRHHNSGGTRMIFEEKVYWMLMLRY